MLCGGTSATRQATEETQAVADQVKAQLEEKENRKFNTFKALEYKTQVVAGTNYFIKVQVGEEEFAHLRVFQSLPHENQSPVLHGYQMGKTRHEEVGYF